MRTRDAYFGSVESGRPKRWQFLARAAGMVALGGLVLLATSLAPNVSLDGLGGVDTVAAVTAVAGLTSYGAARQSARQLDRKMIA